MGPVSIVDLCGVYVYATMEVVHHLHLCCPKDCGWAGDGLVRLIVWGAHALLGLSGIPMSSASRRLVSAVNVEVESTTVAGFMHF